MIDTHAHLDFPEFDEDREEVISRAFDNGVKKIINVGVDLERSRKSIAIAQTHKNIFVSVGLHPDYFSEQETVNSEQQDWIGDLKELARNEKVVAIGETGLDYHQRSVNSDQETIDFEEIKKNQKKGFLVQIEIAKELGLPVIVHCRDAWEDLHKIISSFFQSPAFPLRRTSRRNSSKPDFPKFVLHCYSGEKKDTEKFLKLPNVYFSFSGNISYPKPVERAGRLAEAVRMVPLDKIMLDSDSPFLAPQEFRGKRNEPLYVKYIAQKISQIKGISEKEVEEATDENAKGFFEI